jgi:hypothetical protein
MPGIAPGIPGIAPGIAPGIGPGDGTPGIPGIVPGIPITPGGVITPPGCMCTMLKGTLWLIMCIAASLLPGGLLAYGGIIGTFSP